MPTGSMLLQDECLLDHCHSISMPAGVVLLYLPYLFVCCLTIEYAFWCGVSLSAMPSGVVPHYNSCLLVWCLIISDACWCGSSQWTMSVDVVSRYRPCLLVNCHCNQHFTSLVQMEKGWFQVWCYLYRGAIISDMPVDPVQLSDMSACTVQLYQNMHTGFIYSNTQGIYYVKIHQTCLHVGCGSHRFVKLVSYHPGCHLKYIKFCMMHE